MKELHLTCTWVTSHVVAVPDDFVWDGDLNSLAEVGVDLYDLSSQNADLTGWE